MRFLLDTHLLLWTLSGSRQLSARSRSFIDDPAHHLAFSAVSIGEIAVKRSLDRPDFQTDPDLVRTELVRFGYEDLPLTSSHACALATLPWIHEDPFDRLLIAQAIVEGITLLTADTTILRYPAPFQRI